MDVFEKYKNYYQGGVTRPQPTDFVLEYFKNSDKGFFIDVGAHDGITWNNSIALSEIHNWSGICIEAHPKVFKLLIANRTERETCLNIGSHSEDGSLTFREINGYSEMLSGFIKDYDPKHEERIKREIYQYGGSYQEIKVNVEKLETTISNHNVNKVDYLSIDVEGAELHVLKGLNLKLNRPTLISIEDNGYTSDPHDFLQDNKYTYITKIAGDCFYENSIL
tara:strand:+ start:155 stop:820 length:666 start_codon:yes stop_codon:yes gene_type:complete